MRTTTGGIAVDKVTAGLTMLAVTGNDKLMEFLADGAKISRIEKPGGEMQIEIVPGGGTKPDPRNPGYWGHPYGKAMNHGRHIPKFGQTPPINLETRYVNGNPRLVITMPPPEKRAKPLRGKNKVSKEKLTGEPPLLAAIDAADKPQDTAVTPCYAAPAPHTDPLAAVQNVVNQLNALDNQLKGGVKIQRSLAGHYSAVVEIHPGDE